MCVCVCVCVCMCMCVWVYVCMCARVSVHTCGRWGRTHYMICVSFITATVKSIWKEQTSSAKTHYNLWIIAVLYWSMQCYAKQKEKKKAVRKFGSDQLITETKCRQTSRQQVRMQTLNTTYKANKSERCTASITFTNQWLSSGKQTCDKSKLFFTKNMIINQIEYGTISLTKIQSASGLKSLKSVGNGYYLMYKLSSYYFHELYRSTYKSLLCSNYTTDNFEIFEGPKLWGRELQEKTPDT